MRTQRVFAGEALLSDRATTEHSPDNSRDELLADLVHQHSRLVYRIAYAALRSHHDAEDATQETFFRSLSLGSEISNFAVPDQQAQNVMPLLRQLKIEGSTVAQLGKPLVVGSVDDPNSKRQFQLEVMVSKLR